MILPEAEPRPGVKSAGVIVLANSRFRQLEISGRLRHHVPYA